MSPQPDTPERGDARPEASLCRGLRSAPVSFQRLYAESVGPEHPATAAYVANVIASMNACLGLNPFKVRLRFGDGTAVVVKPKGAR